MIKHVLFLVIVLAARFAFAACANGNNTDTGNAGSPPLAKARRKPQALKANRQAVQKYLSHISTVPMKITAWDISKKATLISLPI